MQSHHYTKYIVLVCAALMSFACSHDELLQPTDSVKSSLTFHPTLGGALDTRAIGDATGIDQLIVGVYEGSGTLSKKLSYSDSWTNVQANGITLSLIEGRTYKLVFWAQHSSNTAYELTDDGQITVDYTDYLNGGFAKMEELDAFCATATVTVGASPNEQKTITLSRPLAQLNFADKTTQPDPAAHRSIVTFHSIPTALNPFTDAVTMTNAEDDGDDLAFTFADYDHLQNNGTVETLPVEDENGIVSNYYYVSCNYLLAPATSTNSKVAVTLEMQQPDGIPIQQFEFKDDKAIVIERNKKTNAFGALVQQPQTWSIWDGTASTEPEKDAQNRYIIDAASDLAWLSQNDIGTAGTFLQTVDIDMADKAIGSLKLPAGSTYDGGGKQLKNYQNSLFGDATELSVQHLMVDHITVPSSGVTHVGVLINTLTGSATFNNVTVSNSTATTTNGAAGGFVGYIKNNGTEPLEVNFTQCTATANVVSGSLTSGVYVGRFRGYNNAEKLTFSADCNDSSATFGASAKASYYTTANAACWFTDAQNTFGKYSGWLGCEEFYRGTVNYGAVRYIPKWDGTTKIDPLTEQQTINDTAVTVKLIYSAFDLAKCAGTNPGSIKFMEHVDLGAKVFNPLTGLSTLIGENKTIYNLKVETTFNNNSWVGGGFVRKCSAATIENITFKDADVKVTHVEGSEGDAYASIVCGTAEGTNTMTNVKVIGGKLYGCNKMGGIAGYMTGTFTATNCVVDGLNIENYDSGGKDSFGFKANGEVGGAFGFLAANATISGCYVKNTTLNCVGVNNGRALIFFKYAGRHVNEFIGDIRTPAGQTIRITLEENNFTGNTYKNRKDQYSGCKYIGHCYYTTILTIQDTKGTVYVNDKSITVVQNY